jgi:predicted HAD superfamily Cof-like phosphohydrolase
MKKEQEAVREFHTKHHLTINDKPTIPEEQVHYLRVNLHEEENKELIEAIKESNIVKIADALGDKMYVLLGTAISYGIDLEAVFWEIHKSNMTKEEAIREDGKILKGPNFKPPNILLVLRNQ